MKPDKSVRICGDYKVNKCAILDNYPVPKAEDLLAMLAGGNKFTKFDLSRVYKQIVLDEESRDLLTINQI